MTQRLTMAVLVGALLSMGLVSCEHIIRAVPRAGSGSDGSARWAFDLARERVEAEGFDPENELYVIEGATIWNDGRLPANSGSWRYWFWSESRHLKLEIEVRYDGGIQATTASKTDPPAGRPPMPADWADSTAIFRAAPAFSTDMVDGAVTNLAEWPGEAGGAFWAIGCLLTRDCPIHYVRWDGLYLGETFP